jgi:membrane-associated protease RseP (regulator of RpoE activity)
MYIFHPTIVKAIKVPPIMPLIPYLPQIFKLDFLPPFYFAYWIIILAIVAIPHEFAHGIFAAYNKIKIKKTGFGFFPFFLPIFLAAFVELDEKIMQKKDKFSQMAILSAGTFANVIFAIIAFIMMWLFFSMAFTPSGVQFNSYTYEAVELNSILKINNVSFENKTYENFVKILNQGELNEIETKKEIYLGVRGFIEDKEILLLYRNDPAIKNNLKGAIIEIEGEKIKDWDSLKEELYKKSPGEEIKIKTKYNDKILSYEIVLGENPSNATLPHIGIGYEQYESSGLMGKIVSAMGSFKKDNIYYESKWAGSEFIFNLLWWLVLICVSVAIINMLPVGIFDGGRFFYLTIFAITKSKKKAEKTFDFMTKLFLFVLLLLMVFWIIGLF